MPFQLRYRSRGENRPKNESEATGARFMVRPENDSCITAQNPSITSVTYFEGALHTRSLRSSAKMTLSPPPPDVR